MLRVDVNQTGRYALKNLDIHRRVIDERTRAAGTVDHPPDDQFSVPCLHIVVVKDFLQDKIRLWNPEYGLDNTTVRLASDHRSVSLGAQQ